MFKFIQSWLNFSLGCNFVTQYFGYYMELINQGKGPVNWSPYLSEKESWLIMLFLF